MGLLAFKERGLVGIDNPILMGHNVGEKLIVRDDFDEVEYDSPVPNVFRYVGFCIVNGEITHYYV